MEIATTSGQGFSQTCDALVVPVAERMAAEGLTVLDDGLDPDLRDELLGLVQAARFTGKPGATLSLTTLGRLPARRLVLAGIGDEERASEDAIVRGYGAAIQQARDVGASHVIAVAPPPINGDDAAALAAGVLGARLGLYQFTRYHGSGRSTDNGPKAIERLEFAGTNLDPAALARGEATAEAVCLARDLVNEPASVLTPAAFAERAREIAEREGLEIEVLDEVSLVELGANAMVAVGGGSANPPRLIRLRYRPEGDAASGRVVGLVGKAITFDTGGYSIKTFEGMLQMKGDMAGGAATLATMSVLRRLGCPVAVDATICAAENMISGNAFRPGDIIHGMNGVTIEILSTDAEGRLVLADGLVDAARRGATELIDLATLTGAIVVALGDGATGLFSSDDRLANDLLAASAAAGERFWRMPLFEELNEKIKGDVGDVKNSGGRAGGSITAALFLQKFSEGLPWAHLDIAGSARTDRNGPLGAKGGSGVGVRTLLRYLLTPASS